MSDTEKPDDAEVHLKEIEVAERMQVTLSTVQRWRRKKIGPNYMKLGDGSIRYRNSDILAYEESSLVTTNKN